MAKEGTVVLAHYQKTGRGLSGNSWESEPKKNLLASIILFPEFLPAGKQFYISKITCLGLLYCLEKIAPNVSIKWPNDIYIENRKVAGILIENAVRSDFLCSSVLGIGLNVNQQNFASDAPNPVSLKQITGDDFDITHLAELLIEQIDYWYEKLKSHSLEEIDKMYFDNLYKKNEWVLFKQGDFTFEAKITGIGEYGQLILKDKREKLLSFMFKEVEFVL
jgi:BirA family biotin operon repressor/biotin-[acetyl-CoA-carboxylase] ligase